MAVTAPLTLKQRLTKHARSITDPLFLQDYFLQTGHDENTPNATATFIKFQKHIYACTCRHVSKSSTDSIVVGTAHYPTTALMIDKSIINLSSFCAVGLQPSLHSPNIHDNETGADVAIARIDTVWDILASKKGKSYIDLDKWAEPAWSQISCCNACGYFNEHKTLIGNQVQIPMGEVVAEVSSCFGPQHTYFALSSKLPKPHGYYFSGISGGPVFGVWGSDEENAQFAVTGIVFEGSPSSRKRQPTAESFLSPDDIFIRALTLTPEIFQGWIKQTPLDETERSP